MILTESNCFELNSVARQLCVGGKLIEFELILIWFDLSTAPCNRARTVIIIMIIIIDQAPFTSLASLCSTRKWTNVDGGLYVCVTDMTFIHYLLCAYSPEVRRRTVEGRHIECVLDMYSTRNRCVREASSTTV